MADPVHFPGVIIKAIADHIRDNFPASPTVVRRRADISDPNGAFGVFSSGSSYTGFQIGSQQPLIGEHEVIIHALYKAGDEEVLNQELDERTSVLRRMLASDASLMTQLGSLTDTYDSKTERVQMIHLHNSAKSQSFKLKDDVDLAATTATLITVRTETS